MFICIYCNKRARTVNERNCTGEHSPDGRHHRPEPAEDCADA